MGFESRQHRGKSEIKVLKFVKLNKEQKVILVGLILGDAYLQKTGERNARLRLEHGAKQKDYLLWKMGKFPKLFQGKPKYLERTHPISQKIYGYWRHQSSATPELGVWRKIFYVNGKKIIPRNLGEYLKDILSLAVWYMDGGYYYRRDKVSYLYLGRVSREEAENAFRAIEENFAVIGKILDKKKKGFAIYFCPAETIKLHKKISKHVLPLFGYKLFNPTLNLLTP